MFLGPRHRERPQFQMARHGRGYHVQGHLVKLNNTRHLNLPIPQGQPQQGFWEGYDIKTREYGGAQYAIHRAVEYAYEKGYNDAQKKREHYYSFQKALDNADKEELDELKDRLARESIGKRTFSEIADLPASQIRELLKEARGSSQRQPGGYKEEGDRMRGYESRTRSHRPRSLHRNQEHHRRRPEGPGKCVHRCSEDSSPFESDEEGDYVYR